MPPDLAIITGSYKDIVGFFIQDKFHKEFLQSVPYTPEGEEARQKQIVADLGKTQQLIDNVSKLETLTALWRCYRPEAEDTYVPGLMGARIFAESADKFRPLWTGFLSDFYGTLQKIFQFKSVAYLPTIGAAGETIKEAYIKPAGCSLLHVPGVPNVWMLFHMADSTGPRDQIQMTVVMPAILFPKTAVEMPGLNLSYHDGSTPFNWDNIFKHPDVSQVFSLLLEKGDCCEARLPLLFPDKQTEIYKNDQAFRHPCKLQGVDGSYYYHFPTLIDFLRAVSVPESQDVIPLSPEFSTYVDDFLQSFGKWKAKIVCDRHRQSLEKLLMLCGQLCKGGLTEVEINRVFMLLGVGYSDWSNIILFMIDELSLPLLSEKALKAKSDLPALDLKDVDVSIKVPLVKLQLDLRNLLKQLRLMLPWVLTRDEPDDEYVNLRQDEGGGVHEEIKASFSVENRFTTNLSSVLSDNTCDQACVVLRGDAEFAKSLKKLNGHVTLFVNNTYVTTVAAAFSRYCNAILQGDQAEVYNALNILVTQYPNWLKIIDNIYCPEEIWSPVEILLDHLKQALPSYVEREEGGLKRLVRNQSVFVGEMSAAAQVAKPDQEVIMITGSVTQIVKLLIAEKHHPLFLENDQERTAERDAAFKALIKKDMQRQAFLVWSKEELEMLQQRWQSSVPSAGYDYIQGMPDARLWANPTLWNVLWTWFLRAEDKEEDETLWKYEAEKNIIRAGFAYLPDLPNSDPAGFSLFCKRNLENLWVLMHIAHANQPTDPASSIHRQFTLVLPTIILPKKIDEHKELLRAEFKLDFSVHQSIETTPLSELIQNQKVSQVISSVLNKGVCRATCLSLISAEEQDVSCQHNDQVFTRKGLSRLGGRGDFYYDFSTLMHFLAAEDKDEDILRHTARACADVRSSAKLKNIFGKFNALYVYDLSMEKEAFFVKNKVMLDRLFFSVAVLCDPESTENQINRAMITLGAQYSHWLKIVLIMPEDLALKDALAELLAQLKAILPWVIEISREEEPPVVVSRFKAKAVFSLSETMRAQAAAFLRSAKGFGVILDLLVTELEGGFQKSALLEAFARYCRVINEDQQKLIKNAFHMLITQYDSWRAMMFDEAYPGNIREYVRALLDCLKQSLSSYVEIEKDGRFKLVSQQSISIGQGAGLYNLPREPSLPASDQVLPANAGLTLSVFL